MIWRGDMRVPLWHASTHASTTPFQRRGGLNHTPYLGGVVGGSESAVEEGSEKSSRDETRAPLRVWTGQKKDISSTRVTSVTVNTRGERGTEFKKKHKGKQNVCYGVFFIFEFFEEIMPHIFSYVSTLLPCDTFWGETQVYDQIAISLGLGFYTFIFPNRAENKNENK